MLGKEIDEKMFALKHRVHDWLKLAQEERKLFTEVKVKVKVIVRF